MKRLRKRSLVGPAVSALAGTALLAAVLWVNSSAETSLPALQGNADTVATEDAARVSYNVFVLQERIRILTWYRKTTTVIFWMVVLATLAGLFMSWLQFRASLVIKPASQSAVSPSDPTEQPAHEIELKAMELSVAFKSQSLAALVLFISLLFFGLYVRYVYPLQPVPRDVQNEVSSDGEAQNPGGPAPPPMSKEQVNAARPFP
jgi:hypothetical protein